jgi:hypothetical protein
MEGTKFSTNTTIMSCRKFQRLEKKTISDGKNGATFYGLYMSQTKLI